MPTASPAGHLKKKTKVFSEPHSFQGREQKHSPFPPSGWSVCGREKEKTFAYLWDIQLGWEWLAASRSDCTQRYSGPAAGQPSPSLVRTSFFFCLLFWRSLWLDVLYFCFDICSSCGLLLAAFFPGAKTTTTTAMMMAVGSAYGSLSTALRLAGGVFCVIVVLSFFSYWKFVDTKNRVTQRAVN